MSGHRRLRPTRPLGVAAMAVVGLTLATTLPVGTAVVDAPPAAADRIDDKRAEARRIAARLEELEVQASILDEDYNEARLQLAELDAEVRAAQADLARTVAAIGTVQSRMGTYALDAYVRARPTVGVIELFTGSADGTLVLRQGYTAISYGNQQALADQLRERREDADMARAALGAKQARQEELKAHIESRQEAVAAAEAETERLLSRVQGELARLVAQEEARRRAAAERAARARAEAARAARNRGATGAPRVRRVPPPPSPGASGAVEAAMAMIGTPYRWATSNPEVGFDCSGLTKWAWGRAGRSLPHSSRAQYASLPKVDFEDLRPGDLLFFGSPIHHVGMYVGSGQMVHAPRRGTTVRVDSAYRRDFHGAARP